MLELTAACAPVLMVTAATIAVAIANFFILGSSYPLVKRLLIVLFEIPQQDILSNSALAPA
jgi:hypothetical protein